MDTEETLLASGDVSIAHGSIDSMAELRLNNLYAIIPALQHFFFISIKGIFEKVYYIPGNILL